MSEPDPRERDRTALVADELPLARLGVVSVLDAQGFDVVAETHSGRELASVAAVEHPELVVVGRPADLDVVATVRRLARVRPAPAVVALLDPAAGHPVPYLLALGVRGLALRSGPVDDLAAVVSAVAKGGQRVAGGLVGVLGADLRPAPGSAAAGPGDLLSGREREVLAFLAQGRTNREIAAQLSVTVATVKSHLVRVYAKLEAANRNEAVGRAVELGLLR